MRNIQVWIRPSEQSSLHDKCLLIPTVCICSCICPVSAAILGDQTLTWSYWRKIVCRISAHSYKLPRAAHSSVWTREVDSRQVCCRVDVRRQGDCCQSCHPRMHARGCSSASRLFPVCFQVCSTTIANQSSMFQLMPCLWSFWKLTGKLGAIP